MIIGSVHYASFPKAETRYHEVCFTIANKIYVQKLKFCSNTGSTKVSTKVRSIFMDLAIFEL
jgi:hypothetical protein